jgi:hypothetical protein
MPRAGRERKPPVRAAFFAADEKQANGEILTLKTTAWMLLLATAAWAQQVAVPQGGSLGPSCHRHHIAARGSGLFQDAGAVEIEGLGNWEIERESFQRHPKVHARCFGAKDASA